MGPCSWSPCHLSASLCPPPLRGRSSQGAPCCTRKVGLAPRFGNQDSARKIRTRSSCVLPGALILKDGDAICGQISGAAHSVASVSRDEPCLSAMRTASLILSRHGETACSTACGIAPQLEELPGYSHCVPAWWVGHALAARQGRRGPEGGLPPRWRRPGAARRPPRGRTGRSQGRRARVA